MGNPLSPATASKSRLLAVVTFALAAVIFIVDSVTPVEAAIGVFYVAVVLLAVRFLSPRWVVVVALACMAATVCSHFLSEGDPRGQTALINRLIDILAIAITTFLALKNQSEKLALQRAKIERLTRLITLGEMTASIAHEVNQPLAAVMASSEACLRWLALQPPNLQRAQLSVEQIIRDANRADEILRRIRALVKGTAIRKDWLNINETISDTIALMHNDMRQNGVSLRTTFSPDLPPVQGDRIQLQQVILNLLCNAIEAMSNVDEQTRELFVSSQAYESGGVLIVVRDSGTGLNPESLERVFDAFHTTKPNGMGMGLAICRAIVASHGGKLWAAPNAPQGAIFQFILPGR
jgi:signal transduction histidine kinase